MTVSLRERNPSVQSVPLRLSALPTAAGTARQLSIVILARWGLLAVQETVEVLVSELVTNAVAHGCREGEGGGAGTDVTFGMMVSGSLLRVEVWDPGTGLPVRGNADDMAESGRGLQIVSALTDGRWGATLCAAGGKVTWAEIDLNGARA
jgi:anti-sigma regulatory factor (Ser/Thr protein kinase)